MFLKEIEVIETMPCLADERLFKAVTRASVSLTEIMPYLNAVLDKPNYQPASGSLTFKRGINGITLQGRNINVTRFSDMAELCGILDFVKNLVNDTADRRAEIEPDYKARKITPILKIYGLLPKTNCKECGEPSCMAFAAKLNAFDAEVDGCPVLCKAEFAGMREKLSREFE